MKRVMCWLLPVILMVISCKKVAEENSCITCDSGKTASTLPVQVNYFRGIRPDDPNGTAPIDNPDRGFRLYYSMYASNMNQPYWSPTVNYWNFGTEHLDVDESIYGNNKIRLVLISFHLTDFLHTPISTSAMANMQYIFDQIRTRGQKVILRFVYRAFDNSEYEQLPDISRHLEQLRSFLIWNEPLIHVVQAGFLGLWGEWHHSGLDGWSAEQKVVIRKLLETVPASRKIEVRETVFKNNAVDAFSGYVRTERGLLDHVSYPALTQAEKNRIGFHNDYFILENGTAEQNGWDYRYPEDDYRQVKAEGRNTIVDGEMPEIQFPVPSQFGWNSARRMREHAYTSFNIIANYYWAIASWKNEQLTASQLRNDNTLVTDDYFSNQYGQEVPRTAFDYIRDHLGYRLQLKEGRVPSYMTQGSSFDLSFIMKNFGFSKMINSRPLYFVMIDQNNQVREIPTSYDAKDFEPSYEIFDVMYTINQTLSIQNDYAPGHYRLGIWMPDASDAFRYNPVYAVKLANGNVEWWTDPQNRYLVNIVGNFDIY